MAGIRPLRLWRTFTTRLLTPRYPYTTPVEARHARRLLFVSLVAALAVVAGAPLGFAAGGEPVVQLPVGPVSLHNVLYSLLLFLNLGGLPLLRRLVHRGRLMQGSILLTAMLYIAALLGYGQSAADDPAILLFMLPLLASALLLSRHGLLITLTVVSASVIGLAALKEFLPAGTLAAGRLTVGGTILYGVLIFVVAGVLLAEFARERQALSEQNLTMMRILEEANTVLQEEIARYEAADQARQKEALRYRALFDHSIDGIFLIGLDGRHLVANQRAADMLGYTVEELARLGVNDLVVPEAREAAEKVRQTLLAGETLPIYERQFVRRDGSIVPVELNVALITDPDGRPSHLQSIARDISERKAAERRERLAYELARQLTGLLDTGDLLYSTVERLTRDYGYYHCQCYVLDPISRRLELYAASGITGDLLVKSRHYLMLEATPSLVARAARSRQPVMSNDVQAEPDYLPNPFLPLTRSELALPLEFGSELLGVLDIQHDQRDAFNERELRGLEAIASQVAIALSNARAFDEIRALNSELEQRMIERTAELIATTSDLDAFAYSVSHDLRAPLRSIDGFSQALIEEYGDQLNEQARDYLRRLRRGSQRMGRLIDDLLTLSRVTRRQMNPQPVDLSRMARDMVASLRARSPQRDVSVVIQDPMPATGDPALLQTALEHLFDNAWKFTAGTDNPRIEFGSIEQEGELVYFLRDNGIGFDMAYVGKLFGIFQRLHRDEDYEGTGIGLSIVQRVMARHGGRVWAEGVPEQGSVFYFTLPGPDSP